MRKKNRLESTAEPLYRRYLREEMDRRKRLGPYSLREYAVDLGVEPSKLSQYISGACGFSGQRARMMAERMRLSPVEVEIFVASAESLHARSQVSREVAQERLEELQRGAFQEINAEKFTMIRDWYHMAILELMDLSGFQSSISWIAKALEIPESSVREAIERLERLGLLDRTQATWVQTQKDLETPQDFASRAIRDYHRQILGLAQSRLEKIPVEKRDVSSAVFAIDSSLVPEMKKLVRRFHIEAASIVGRSKEKDALYNLNLQFMPLYERPEK